MKKYKFLAMGLLCHIGLWAQNETDVLRFSESFNLGTARSQGAGGAFGAVGADFSSVYLNPAGIGLYRRNEFHFSAAITGNTATSNFLDNQSIGTRTNFNIPSFGIVLSKVNTGINGGDATDGVVNYNFAIGHTRTNSFQQNIYADGFNSKSTITSYFAQQANGIPVSQFAQPGYNLGNLAWNAYLIDTASNNTTYYSPWFANDNNYRLLQTQTLSKRGASDEYNFNMAVNIDNTLYLGAGLVLAETRYEVNNVFTESDPNKTVVDSIYGHNYNSSELRMNVNSSGNGVAGRFGLIFRPIDVFRVGLSVQTATRLHMTDNYQFSVSSDINWQNIGKRESKPDPGQFEYDLVTPARYTASASLMHPDMGFIAVDVEQVDYSRGRLTSDAYSFTKENMATKSTYQVARALRIGAEYKYKKMYRVRAGYSLNTSPYKPINGVASTDLFRNSYSFGLGYTNAQHFIDFASVLTTYNEYYTPYTVDGGFSPLLKTEHVLLNFVVTAGVRF